MKNLTNEESELSKLLIVMGYIATKEFESIPEKVRILNNFGFSNRQMALVCDTSEGTIAKQKTINKNKKKKK